MLEAMLGVSIALSLGNFVMLVIVFQRMDAMPRRRRAP